MNKKNIIIFGMIFLISVLLIGFISANCCERLKNDGAWCQDAATTECATGTNPFTSSAYKNIPTSCASTSYCRLGTCVNSLQGSCMPNTPQITCNNEGGVWKGADVEDLPECQQGCCLLGNQAAFTTLTECKKLSSEYGLTTDYRSDIQTELECIASITSDEMGACVFERDYQKTCLMISQTDCNQIKLSKYTGEEDVEGVSEESVEFHNGFLCSASQLETICGPRGGTNCIDEKVYFMDTCGNLANIYDSSKLNDNNYWTYIQEPSCDDGLGNKKSRTCGACDYFSGSICKSYTQAGTTKPVYGNSICASLDCKYDTNNNGRIESGENYLHGETWCVENSKTGLTNKSLPGSRQFRMMCYNGEVTIEPCSEFKNQVCIESEVSSFSTAKCVLNLWQDCVNTSIKEDCLDKYARDCKWISGYSVLKVKDVDGNIQDGGKDENNVSGSCVPKYAPGFDFWAGEGYGPELCSVGSSVCIAEYEIGIMASRNRLSEADWDYRISKCVKNCYCLPGYTNGAAKNEYEDHKPASDPRSYNAWINMMDGICTSLGDCGNKKNYLGYYGENKTVFTSEFIRKP
jgi:hypothetical protein